MKGVFGGSLVIASCAIGLGLRTLLGTDFGLATLYDGLRHRAAQYHVAATFFPSGEVPLWQVLVLCGSASIIFVFLYADRLKNRMDAGPAELRVLECAFYALGVISVLVIIALVRTSAAAIQ